MKQDHAETLPHSHQQLGQPTPLQPAQPEQPTRSHRRRALQFAERTASGPAALLQPVQSAWPHAEVRYNTAVTELSQHAKFLSCEHRQSSPHACISDELSAERTALGAAALLRPVLAAC